MCDSVSELRRVAQGRVTSACFLSLSYFVSLFKNAVSLFTPPTVPQENRNQAKMIPAVFHSPYPYWKGIILYEWQEMAFKQLRQKEQEKTLRWHPSHPSWTFFSHCSFSKDINEHDDKSRTHHSHFLFFCYLSISNESIHLPRAKGMRGENESHLWCPIVQRWLLWTSLSPASQLPSWQRIPLVSDKRQFAFISCSVERQFQCTQFTKKKHLCYHTNGNGWEQMS